MARLDTSLELLRGSLRQVDGARVLATLVSTTGSTYRKPGARMLIDADGGIVGLLSGGCLESDLRTHAQAVMQGGPSIAIEYDMRGPDDVLFGLGSGCQGAMRILLESVAAGTPAALALEACAQEVARGRTVALVAVHESRHLRLGTHALPGMLPNPLTVAAHAALDEGSSHEFVHDEDGERLRALIQVLTPAPHLLLCGAGPDAEPVARAAVSLGWRVTVVDHRAAYALPERFPGSAVLCTPPRGLRRLVDVDLCHAAVVMSHHLASDVDYLRELAQAPASQYLGLLGPARRRQRVLSELGEIGAGLHSRLRGPVGLDIGAATPEGIALSVIAQIHGWLAGKESARHT